MVAFSRWKAGDDLRARTCPTMGMVSVWDPNPAILGGPKGSGPRNCYGILVDTSNQLQIPASNSHIVGVRPAHLIWSENQGTPAPFPAYRLKSESVPEVHLIGGCMEIQ